ncbi:MAG: hypothetical protein P8J44_00470 [Gammaproteobacteria bacterium]|jgi:hypothetical protein|nr:hypothetical protein [Gammaproteobacteria bacterium]MDG1850568.1 hypothetical protein [Gammaproteobacteria bacterium]
MKTVILSVIVAIIASVATTMVLQDSNQNAEPQATMILEPQINYEQIAEQLDVNKLSVSMEPEAAAWIRLNTGIESSEQKILANAANSACFLTHVEISGIQSPQDKNSCSITLDDFTGYWQVNASTGEGTQSELYCNARCIVWE